VISRLLVVGDLVLFLEETVIALAVVEISWSSKRSSVGCTRFGLKEFCIGGLVSG